MLTNREVLRRLRKLQRELAVIPRINYGGCGVMAAIAGEALQKLGIECEVVTPGSGWRDGRTAAEVRNNVFNVANPREWDDNGLDRGHLALRFRIGGRTYTWDSDAMHRRSMVFGEECGGQPRYYAAGKWGEPASRSRSARPCPRQGMAGTATSSASTSQPCGASPRPSCCTEPSGLPSTEGSPVCLCCPH